MKLRSLVATTVAGLVLAIGGRSDASSTPPALATQVYVAGEPSYGVTSTLIYGTTEAVLVDAQMFNRDATALADMVAARGRRLTAIFITHPDHDHFMGMAILHARFPGAKLYMTPRALAEFQAHRDAVIASQLQRFPGESPSELPTPEALTSPRFTVDGQEVQVLADLQGDYAARPTNSAVWIPSIRTLITDDIAFLGVHPWLGDSTPAPRKAWRASIRRLEALRPRVVIAGHKGAAALSDTAASLEFTDRYLATFERDLALARDARGLTAAVLARYPNLQQERFVRYVAAQLFPKPTT